MDLLLSLATKNQLDIFLKHPAHAVLLEGAPGSGKTATALYLSGRLLDCSVDEVLKQPYVRVFAPAKKTVFSIEDIRDIQSFLQLKTLGKNRIRRIVILEQADTMTIEGQNAFLKTLEEPPIDTVIILLTTNENLLLDTIRSRCGSLHIAPITWEQAYAHFKDTYSEATIRKNYLLSEGQASLLTALLHSDSEHELVTAITQAKTFLKASQYERLILVNDLEKGSGLQLFLLALSKVAHAALVTAADKQASQDIKRWNHAQQVIQDCIDAINKSAIAKLQLSYLCLSI
jgi:replication-associated recombination protein RarA